MYIYSPNSFHTVGVLAVRLVGGWMLGQGVLLLCVCSFLCAGCGLGKGQVALVYAKGLVAPLSTIKYIGFTTFSSKTLLVRWEFPACLGGLWVPPGCPPGASRT